MNAQRHSKASLYGKIGLTALLAAYIAYGVFAQRSEVQYAAAKQDETSLVAARAHHEALALTARLTDAIHFRNRPLDNDFSAVILNRYLTSLDPQKVYFTKADIQNFQSDRYYYDDYLQRGELKHIFHVFDIFRSRVQERAEFAKALLQEHFDFGMSDVLVTDRSDADWIESRVELDGIWKQIVKNDILSLKIDGADPSTINETLNTRYDQFANSILRYSAHNVVEVFLNGYLQELDPHSQYYSPHSADNLEIRLSQQIEGIGAMLRSEDGATVIHSVITGGPAARSGAIHAGDTIVAVSSDSENRRLRHTGSPDPQQTDTENIAGSRIRFQDIRGWRLEDVVDLIRGPKGTQVHLKIVRSDSLPGAAPERISIVREKVELLEQMASMETFELEAGGNPLLLAAIRLPAFYSGLFADSNNNDDDVRSSTRDVAELLAELREQRVDGIVLDLRGNGGGALHEAVNLTSLFIESGPVVQVNKSDGEVEVHYDEGTIHYGGPLVVLVDRYSASAAEILAGAIQDYKRGIVVGETTFGKGTLQSIIPLGQQGDPKIGSVKLSTAKFFRINGTSNQYQGVVPDVVFKTNQFVGDFGERSLHNALLGDVIEPVEESIPWHTASAIESSIPTIRSYNQERMEFNPVFDFLVQTERLRERRSAHDSVSLSENIRKQMIADDEQAQLDILNTLRSALNLEPAEEFSAATYPTEVIDSVFLDEALNILVDLITMDTALVASG